jgi:hypothetical protein
MAKLRFARLIAAWMLVLPCAAWADDIHWLWPDQGHTSYDRGWYYKFSQGSRIVPFAWYRSLQLPGSSTLFVADRLAHYGYIPWPANMDNNPYRSLVAIGFGYDPDNAPIAKGGGWLSMNCAACHTGTIRFPDGKHNMIIEGGPAHADFTRFITDLAQALTETANDATRFAGFAGRVAKVQGETDKNRLMQELRPFAANFVTFADTSQPHSPALPGRLDAFTFIMNRVLSIDLNNQPFPNARFPDAPVRYPWLWNTNSYAWVQYTANLPNDRGAGLPGRNFGQALGVFAAMPDLASVPHFGSKPDVFEYAGALVSYFSSVLIKNQASATDRIDDLRPPKWPLPLDSRLVACGRMIFNGNAAGAAPCFDPQVNCASCHRPRAKDGSFPVVTVGVAAQCDQSATPGSPEVEGCGLGTDSRAAYILACDTAAPGPLASAWYIDRKNAGAIWQGDLPILQFKSEPGNSIELTQEVGASSFVATSAPWLFKLIGRAKSAAQVATILGATNLSVLRGAIAQAPQGFVARAGGSSCANDTNADMPEPSAIPPTLAYRAVALNGIWAAGRYLHNGSVPTLRDLLKHSCAPADAAARPDDCRPDRFTTGSDVYDIKNVGFVFGPNDGAEFDTSVWGNRNTGHEGPAYGTELTGPQKDALIEYLKYISWTD